MRILIAHVIHVATSRHVMHRARALRKFSKHIQLTGWVASALISLAVCSLKLSVNAVPIRPPRFPTHQGWNKLEESRIYVKQLNTLPDIFSIFVLDDERGSFKWHSSTVQETRAKVMSYKREVQSWLHTRAGQIDGERRTIGDLQTHTQ